MGSMPRDRYIRKKRSLRGTLTAVFIVLLLILLALHLWREREDRVDLPHTITIYGFSALSEVMTEGILPAFRDVWRETTGEKIEFITTFAGSGTITDRIVHQIPVDVAILASEMDGLRLVQKGVVLAPVWKHLPQSGVFSRSPLILVVEEGNPKGIDSFEDLAREGIRVVHADPLTSGGGEWAILSVYGSAYRRTGDREQAADALASIWRNVTAEAPSARSALVRFSKGNADALITYEREAIDHSLTTVRSTLESVFPPATVVSEHVVVPIQRNISQEEKDRVDALVQFLWSEKAQKILVRFGFRSVNDEWNENRPEFESVEACFTLDDLGGPKLVKKEILDAVWRDRILPTLSVSVEAAD